MIVIAAASFPACGGAAPYFLSSSSESVLLMSDIANESGAIGMRRLTSSLALGAAAAVGGAPRAVVKWSVGQVSTTRLRTLANKHCRWLSTGRTEHTRLARMCTAHVLSVLLVSAVVSCEAAATSVNHHRHSDSSVCDDASHDAPLRWRLPRADPRVFRCCERLSSRPVPRPDARPPLKTRGGRETLLLSA